MVYQETIAGSLLEINEFNRVRPLCRGSIYEKELEVELIDNVWLCICMWFHTDVRDRL